MIYLDTSAFIKLYIREEHVAAAVLMRAERFVTFDDRQRQLAETVGLNCS